MFIERQCGGLRVSAGAQQGCWSAAAEGARGADGPPHLPARESPERRRRRPAGKAGRTAVMEGYGLFLVHPPPALPGAGYLHQRRSRAAGIPARLQWVLSAVATVDVPLKTGGLVRMYRP